METSGKQPTKRLKERLEDDDRQDIGKGHLYEDDINKKHEEIGSRHKNHGTQRGNIKKG
ncbi:MAG: hypothetical protein JO370_16750 [Paucibacter sp.]|nr:hypothetical protein [Roseateles sp.]